ncbi:hypothetical protein BV511_03230 [Methylorubrum extorquens]|uniref:hypothetical protein n=1 Tax=Methylorubrum extorquens TaxID=408 RepID=UPI0009727758|nr:hypothetical protein [Methylorubrum extorquens]APX83824.1 hypothetical protein BV511_03230 [Methylorubrum extorquens]
MTGIEIAGLLKDYGPWGAVALLALALMAVVSWWRECMNARIEDAGRAATALERAASANAAAATALDDVREGQMEIARLVTQAMKGAEGSDELTKELLRDIKRGLDARGGHHG